LLVLPGTLTLREAMVALRMFEQTLKSDDAATLIVDASALRAFDSAAVAVLLECRRMARSWNKGFEIQGAPAKLTDLVLLYGVDSLLAFAAPPTIQAST
jgi:phospholipid transport system transporter-binding protein